MLYSYLDNSGLKNRSRQHLKVQGVYDEMIEGEFSLLSVFISLNAREKGRRCSIG